jgi:hypothetical protein
LKCQISAVFLHGFHHKVPCFHDCRTHRISIFLQTTPLRLPLMLAEWILLLSISGNCSWFLHLQNLLLVAIRFLSF